LIATCRGEVNSAHAAARQLFYKRVLGGAEVRLGGDGAQMTHFTV
jgi:hypothetical protein